MSDNHTETERRWVVKDISFVMALIHEKNCSPILQTQGYLATGDRTIRTRVESGSGINQVGWLTVKTKKDESGSGKEWEIYIDPAFIHDIPPEAYLGRVRKFRYNLGMGWVVDVFTDLNTGLIIAEREQLNPTDDISNIAVPSWCGKEVTNDHRYSCSQLALMPFGAWSDEEKYG